jgi:micrococcal nuclease
MRWPILFLALILVSGCLSGHETQVAPEKTCEQAISEIPQIIADAQSSPTAEVTRVVDGDTVELADGNKVRFNGINTPEHNENHFLEAKQNMELLVLNKTVHLQKDISDKDKYGRELRYVFTADKFTNAEQVSAGLASSFVYPPDTKYSFLFNCLEEKAKEQGLGMWQGIGEYNFSITIHQNPDDVQDPNLEYVVLTNLGSDLDMGGWQMKDEATHIYTFGNINLGKGESITVYRGKGTDSENTRYWNLKTTVWNNDGDTVFLRDAEGNVAAIYAY